MQLWQIHFYQKIARKKVARVNAALKSHTVARPGREGEGAVVSPHRPAEYAKYHVFSTFEANFCTKSENSPLSLALKSRNCLL